MWHSRPVSTPPPFMANAILNFHFDFLNTSLSAFAKVIAWKQLQKAMVKSIPRYDKKNDLSPNCGLWSDKKENKQQANKENLPRQPGRKVAPDEQKVPSFRTFV